MKRLLLIACMIQFGYAGLSQDAEATANADTSYWKTGGLSSLTFTQVSLSDNWAAGGVNSWSVNGFFTAFADYQKDKIVWKNAIEMGYGLINQKIDGENVTDKTDDRLNLITDFGYKISENIAWSSILDFRTQFDEGILRTDLGDSTISKFFSPAYLIIATGLSWNPSASFSVSYSPVGGKFTFVGDEELSNAGAYGVDPGKHARAELGSFLKMSYTTVVVENVNFDSRLEMFYNYNGNEEFSDVDVNWQNILVMKVNDFLTVNWQTLLIYDRDVRFNVTEDNPKGEASGQFKSVFGVGLSYNFGQSR